MASWGAFSATSRPDHTAGPPPGPGVQRSTSTPLRIGTAGARWAQAREVCSETAAKELLAGDSATADSSHGTGGVCRVVTRGTSTVWAIATGRWWRLLLCTTSKRVEASRARSSISPR